MLLGRDSLVVNTGGEKVFVEEVEDVLKRHDDVVDVLGDRAPERAVRPGGHRHRPARSPDADSHRRELRDWCSERLARYKAPRAFVFVERIERHPSGKANYRWARVTSERATEAL